jgi:uncharacterized protein YodC (DUF2158 family)
MHDHIAANDLVRRKTGGPAMLVLSLVAAEYGAKPMAICAWPENKRVASTAVPLDQLVLVP